MHAWIPVYLSVCLYVNLNNSFTLTHSRTQTIKNGLLRLAESETSAFDGGELPMKRERRLEIDSRRGF
jgi:hypothetical protein